MYCSTPDFPVHHQLLELVQTHVYRVSDAMQLFHPLSSLLLLPSIFSSIRVLSSKSVLHIKWPKYWSFNISHSNEYSGLISFAIDWFDLLAVQGTLSSLLQHHSSKTSILRNGSITWNFFLWGGEGVHLWDFCSVRCKRMCCLAPVVIFAVLDNTLMRQQLCERNLGKWYIWVLHTKRGVLPDFFTHNKNAFPTC